MAVANYEGTYNRYPPPYLTDDDGQAMHTWRMLILPYIEQDNLHKDYDFKKPWDELINLQLAGRMPKIYALHGDYKPGLTITNYLAIVGPNTVWRPGKPVTHKEVTDGSSNTILIVENRGLNVHWMEPRDLDFDTMDWTVDSPRGISSKYDGPAVAFLDGSVRRLSKNHSPAFLRALATIDGGEEVDPDGAVCEPLPDGRQRPVTKP